MFLVCGDNKIHFLIKNLKEAHPNTLIEGSEPN